MRRRPTLAAAAGVLALAASGCGSTSNPRAQPPSGGSPYLRLVAGYVAYARFARTHGMPNLPDPQVDDQGNDHASLDRQGAWGRPPSVIAG